MEYEKLTGVAAMALLELFLQKRWELTEEQADSLFDTVIATLEKARDERWRFQSSKDTDVES